MQSFDWDVVVKSMLAFVAGNIDDIIIIAIFFAATVNSPTGFKKRHVILGQCIGYTIALVLSLLGWLAGVFIPLGYIGLLGFLPFSIGVVQMRKWPENIFAWLRQPCERGRCRRPCKRRRSPHAINSTPEDGPEDGLDRTGENAPLTPDPADGPTCDSMSSEEAEAERVANDATPRMLACCVNVHVMKVTLMSLANGADDVGIYVPLFAVNAGAPWRIVTIVVVFYIMLCLFFVVAFLLVRFRPVARLITRFGSYVFPLVFVGLGLYIMVETGTLCFDGGVRVTA